MKIVDIEARVVSLRDEALACLGVSKEEAAELSLAAPPQPEMGDIGFPCFALARSLRQAPPKIAAQVVELLQPLIGDDDVVASVSQVGPYVNFRWNTRVLSRLVVGEALGCGESFGSDVLPTPEHWMIEFSAPNTNKPQHLGHVRNNLLGAALARIAAHAGHKVTKVNLINDRGIHICKSMLAYARFSNEETPESTGIKGDHLVGRYYVRFEQEFTKEYEAWLAGESARQHFEVWKKDRKESNFDTFRKEFKDTYFNEQSELGGAAKEMLRQWESGDEKVRALWQTMNQWVFEGFDQTYDRLGVTFDRVYLESDTWVLGKDIVEEALARGAFYRLEDGAIACDLEPLGLQGRKILLRRDGTSVYMTQDLGTAIKRFEEYDMQRMVYVVGNEQDYHFQVLFAVLEMLQPALKGRLHHLSYGMVLLPEGKMKSREGKVVDADDLMDEMISLAKEAVLERFPDAGDVDERATAIGMAALIYFILDFTPRSSVHFDPRKSIEFEGRTGPYCLYSYARIQSIFRNVAAAPTLDSAARDRALEALGTKLEQDVVEMLMQWPSIVEASSRLMDPSKVTEHLFKICKSFSTLYNDADHRINQIEGPRRDGLLLLAQAVGQTLKSGLGLLGISVLEAM